MKYQNGWALITWNVHWVFWQKTIIPFKGDRIGGLNGHEQRWQKKLHVLGRVCGMIWMAMREKVDGFYTFFENWGCKIFIYRVRWQTFLGHRSSWRQIVNQTGAGGLKSNCELRVFVLETAVGGILFNPMRVAWLLCELWIKSGEKVDAWGRFSRPTFNS